MIYHYHTSKFCPFFFFGLEFIIGSSSHKIKTHPYFLCQMIPLLPPFCSTKRPQVPLPNAKRLLRSKYLPRFLSLCSQIINRYHNIFFYTSVIVYILNNLLLFVFLHHCLQFKDRKWSLMSISCQSSICFLFNYFHYSRRNGEPWHPNT